MSRNIENSINLGHRQFRRSVGAYHMAHQFSQECATSIATVRSLRLLKDLEGHEGCVNVIVFSPSGDMLASGSDDGKVRLWDPYTFKCLRTMNAHQTNVFAAEFLPFNEQHLASGGNDAELKYYDLETEQGTVYSHHNKKVLRMTVHPEHAHSFMSCSADGTVRMIDTRQAYEASSSGPIETVQGRRGNVVPQALGGGRGPRQAAGGNSSLILNYRTRQLLPQLYCVDFNPVNGQQFIVSSDMGDVRLFDLRKIHEHSPCSYVNLYTHKIESVDDITGCAFSKDGRTIVATALSDAIYTFDVDSNFELEQRLPLCFLGFPTRREPCDNSLHTYSPEMITRYHQWRASSNPRPRLGDRDYPLDSDDDDDLDDDDELGGYDDEGDEELEEGEEELDADENSMNLDEPNSEGNNDDEPREAANEDDEDETNRPAARRGEGGPGGRTIRDLLGGLPILTTEDGTMTIDLQTFLRVASGISRERRARRRRQRPEASAAPSTADSEPGTTATAASSDSTSTLSTAQPATEPNAGAEATTTSQAPVSSTSPTGDGGATSSTNETQQEAPNSSPNGKESEEKQEKVPEEPVDLNLPQPFKMRFTGHSSVQTIKGVGFWGPTSEFVVSGSDDANFFIWNKETGKLLNALEGHQDVVNCVVGHPRIPLLATSGIDDIIKLWEPSGPMPTEEEMEQRIGATARANTNRRMGRAIQCAQQ